MSTTTTTSVGLGAAAPEGRRPTAETGSEASSRWNVSTNVTDTWSSAIAAFHSGETVFDRSGEQLLAVPELDGPEGMVFAREGFNIIATATEDLQGIWRLRVGGIPKAARGSEAPR